MSTPRINSWWNSYRAGVITPGDFKEAIQGLEQENNTLCAEVERLRESELIWASSSNSFSEKYHAEKQRAEAAEAVVAAARDFAENVARRNIAGFSEIHVATDASFRVLRAALAQGGAK